MHDHALFLQLNFGTKGCRPERASPEDMSSRHLLDYTRDEIEVQEGDGLATTTSLLVSTSICPQRRLRIKKHWHTILLLGNSLPVHANVVLLIETYRGPPDYVLYA